MNREIKVKRKEDNAISKALIVTKDSTVPEIFDWVKENINVPVSKYYGTQRSLYEYYNNRSFCSMPYKDYIVIIDNCYFSIFYSKDFEEDYEIISLGE